MTSECYILCLLPYCCSRHILSLNLIVFVGELGGNSSNVHAFQINCDASIAGDKGDCEYWRLLIGSIADIKCSNSFEH